MTETRKIAAILAADVVGYSRATANTRVHRTKLISNWQPLTVLRADPVDGGPASYGLEGLSAGVQIQSKRQ